MNTSAPLLLAALTFACASMAAGACGDRTFSATIERGPPEVDRAAAWYPLDEASNIGRNRAGRGEAALTTLVQIVNDGQRGPVADINGGALALVPPVHRDLTVTFWLKTSQQGPRQMGWVEGPRLIDADVSGLALDFGVSLSLDRLVFGVGDPNDLTRDQTALQSQKAVVDGAWHHVAVTRSGDSGARQIFIDGALDSQGAALPGELALPILLKIGRLAPTNPVSPPLQALLSDLRFYDHLLAAPVIATLAMP